MQVVPFNSILHSFGMLIFCEPNRIRAGHSSDKAIAAVTKQLMFA